MHNIFFEGKTKSFCTKTYQLRGDSASFYHSCKSFCLSVVPSNKRQHRTKTNGHYPPSKLIIQPSLKNPPIISKNIAGALYLSSDPVPPLYAKREREREKRERERERERKRKRCVGGGGIWSKSE